MLETFTDTSTKSPEKSTPRNQENVFKTQRDSLTDMTRKSPDFCRLIHEKILKDKPEAFSESVSGGSSTGVSTASSSNTSDEEDGELMEHSHLNESNGTITMREFINIEDIRVFGISEERMDKFEAMVNEAVKQDYEIYFSHLDHNTDGVTKISKWLNAFRRLESKRKELRYWLNAKTISKDSGKDTIFLRRSGDGALYMMYLYLIELFYLIKIRKLETVDRGTSFEDIFQFIEHLKEKRERRLPGFIHAFLKDANHQVISDRGDYINWNWEEVGNHLLLSHWEEELMEFFDSVMSDIVILRNLLSAQNQKVLAKYLAEKYKIFLEQKENLPLRDHILRSRNLDQILLGMCRYDDFDSEDVKRIFEKAETIRKSNK